MNRMQEVIHFNGLDRGRMRRGYLFIVGHVMAAWQAKQCIVRLNQSCHYAFPREINSAWPSPRGKPNTPIPYRSKRLPQIGSRGRNLINEWTNHDHSLYSPQVQGLNSVWTYPITDKGHFPVNIHISQRSCSWKHLYRTTNSSLGGIFLLENLRGPLVPRFFVTS